MQNDHPVPAKAGDPTEDKGSAPDGNRPDRSLLIVDDDNTFLTRLSRSMETRGFTVVAAHSVAEGLAAIAASAPAFAVIDMRLADGNGLDVIRELKAKRPEGYYPDRIWQYRHRCHRRKARSLRLSGQARGCRRNFQCTHGYPPRQGRASGKSNVGRPGTLGAYSTDL